MGDFLHLSRSAKNVTPLAFSKNDLPERIPVVHTPESSRTIVKGFSLKNHCIPGKSTAIEIGVFLLKLAVLDVARRFSKAKCPWLWDCLQALQLFCIPPLKWIQRWDPFKGIIKCLQTLSRPMLVLSVASSLSDQFFSVEESPTSSNPSQEGVEESPTNSNLSQEGVEASPNNSNPPREGLALSLESHSDRTARDSRTTEEIAQTLMPERWLQELHEELGKQGIVLPERISDDEIRRFYIAANGDFSTLLASIKKTVRWRQTYGILSQDDLDAWAHLVFWHGRDVNFRPCLIIRLGLACANLKPYDKPRFAQAVVSQVEYGVLHLAEPQNPQIIVLMDCDGLSPLGFPMQMMRSIAILLQDHYPNCLGCLFIVRLPTVARVIIQTLTQVLKPVTRKKLRIIGEDYQRVLSNYLETLPYFLGGHCNCSKCSNLGKNQTSSNDAGTKALEWRRTEVTSNDSITPSPVGHDAEMETQESCDHVLRAAIAWALMLLLFIAVIIVWHDPYND